VAIQETLTIIAVAVEVTIALDEDAVEEAAEEEADVAAVAVVEVVEEDELPC